MIKSILLNIIESVFFKKVFKNKFDLLLSNKIKKSLLDYLGANSSSHIVRTALMGRAANLESINRYCLNNIVEINSPLLLISQAMRSGGTLLSQLFDGHPEIAAHPNELKIGFPTKWDWPPINITSDASENFKYLFESYVISFMKNGYLKGQKNDDRHPFFLVPYIQHNIFRKIFDKNSIDSERKILDAYFTSYFNSWINYNGTLNNKSYISAFIPRFLALDELMSKYIDVYPDGKMISVLREPLSYFGSVKKYPDTYQSTYFTDFDKAMNFWKDSTKAMISNKNKMGERCLVLKYEDLILRTEYVMQLLCDKLDIEFNEILLTPTFNCMPIKANSSFNVNTHGIIAESANRQDFLSKDEKEYISNNYIGLYEKALSVAEKS